MGWKIQFSDQAAQDIFWLAQHRPDLHRAIIGHIHIWRHIDDPRHDVDVDVMADQYDGWYRMKPKWSVDGEVVPELRKMRVVFRLLTRENIEEPFTEIAQDEIAPPLGDRLLEIMRVWYRDRVYDAALEHRREQVAVGLRCAVVHHEHYANIDFMTWRIAQLTEVPILIGIDTSIGGEVLNLARRLGKTYLVARTEWDHYAPKGKFAGQKNPAPERRNTRLVEEADMIEVFHDTHNTAILHVVQTAIEAATPINVWDVNGMPIPPLDLLRRYSWRRDDE